jgi:hypothetical protein
MQRFRKITSLEQMSMRDDPDLRLCFLYTLAASEGARHARSMAVVQFSFVC